MTNRWIRRISRSAAIAAVAGLWGASSAMAANGAAMMSQGTPIRKLGRGLANAAAGVLEIPVSISNVGNEEGPVAALSLGLLTGIGRTIARTLIGVVEIVTFPVPFEKIGYGPMMEPEFLLHP